MKDNIRILIADDHPIVRQGLELVVSVQPDLELVAQASNGEEAVQLAQETQPDVMVMDLQMPVKDGLTAIAEIQELGVRSNILVLTSFPEDEMVISAVKSGATGIMLKDSPPEKLLEAIRTVHRGESALHPTIARRLMDEVRQPSRLLPPEDPLTPREIEVLKCLAQGWTNREIALKLDVSVRTVTTHVRNILDKLHLENRTQTALYAVEQGIVTQNDRQ